MKNRKMLRQVPFVLLLTVVVFTRDVHAYLDPGTGSLIFQTVVATLAAVAYALRSYWGRIRMLFGRRGSRRPDDSANQA